MLAADLIAGILAKEGVEVLPAFPHSDIIDSGAKLGIRPFIVRQERHALHMADGYARTSGGEKLACTTVQYGPGSENAIGAVAQCYADNVPVLHIPGGYPMESQGVDPNFNAARQLKRISKWAEMVHDPERIPSMMANAFSQLRNGCPGPVVLEVPIDLFTTEVDDSLLLNYQPQGRFRPCAAIAEVRALADELLNENSLIIAGQGILYSQASSELTQLAELTQTPVLSTLNGKSAMPENHPLYLGCGGGARPDMVNSFLDRCSTYVGLGTSFTRSDYITPFPVQGKRFVQLTNRESDLAKDYPLHLGIMGDARETLRALIREVNSRLEGQAVPDTGLAEEIAAQKAVFMEEWMPLLTSNEVPINPYRVIWEVMQGLDRQRACVTHDAGSPRDQVTPFYESLVPHGYMGWGKTTQLGMGMGLMHGAKLARPDWQFVNIMGDAAIGMVAMDLETAARNHIGTTTIVLKNSVMGGYTKYHPNAAERYQIEALGGDYAALAESLGAYGETVEDPDQLAAALQRALAENEKGRPALLQIITAEEGRMARNLPQGL